jgi:serine/threonine-protein kinase
VPARDGHGETISVPQGTLALRVRPYAVVYVDGRRIGLTPMPPMRLYIGRHRVRLVNEALSRSVSRSVMIRPNKRTVLDVNLAEGT